MREYVFSSIIYLLTALFLITSGYFLGMMHGTPSHPITRVGEVNTHVGIVHFDGVEDGVLVGSVEGNPVRLMHMSEVAVPVHDGSFRLHLNELGLVRTEVIPLHIPKGASFVASRNGKKIYPLGSSGAKRIALVNRIYFVTEEEARMAGYTL